MKQFLTVVLSLCVWAGLAASTGCSSCDEPSAGLDSKTDDGADLGDLGRVDPPPSSGVEGQVILPRGLSPEGSVLLNRFGRFPVAANGRVTFEAARDGLTLSLLLPPQGDTGDKAGGLLFATLNLDEREPVETQLLDMRAAAIALTLLDPRTSTRSPSEVDALLETAQNHPKIRALADILGATFDPNRNITSDPQVLAALDVATDALLAELRHVGPFPTTHIPEDLLHDGLELVRPIAVSTRLIALSIDDGHLAFSPLPLVPNSLVLDVHEVDLQQTPHADRGALFEGEDIALGAPFDLDSPIPTDTVLAVSARFGDDESETLLANELSARWAPRISPCAEPPPPGFDAAIAHALACPGATEAEREAGRRITALGRTLSLRTLARHASSPLGAGLDRAGAWTAVSEKSLTDRIYIVSGDPWTPRPTLATAPVSPLSPGDTVAVGGHLVTHPRTVLLLEDAAGRRVRPHVSPSEDLVEVDIPDGLAGAITLVAIADGGTGRLPLGEMRHEVSRFVPAAISGPATVRVEGRGFYPGLVLTLGTTTITAPADTTERAFTVDIDPANFNADTMTYGTATLTRLTSLAVLEPTGDISLQEGESLIATLSGLTPDAPLTVETQSLALPVRMLSPGRSEGRAIANIDTTGLSPGAHTLTFAVGTRTTTLPLTIRGRPTLTRDIRFRAPTESSRAIELSRALGIANGTLVVSGRFQRVDMGFKLGNVWHCPLDISPDEAAIPPASCSSTYVRCDEGWYWDTVSNPDRWLTVTRPPGRGSTGVRCPVIEGPNTWEGMAPENVFDHVTTEDAVGLGGQVLTGPMVKLTLPNARGGGLTVTEVAGKRNDVVLDLVIGEAYSTSNFPVLTLDGAVGVRGRVTIAAAPGNCKVGLRIVDAQDVDLESLSVEGCEVGVEVVRSSDVRLGRQDAPAILGDGRDGLKIEESRDVVVHVEAAGFERGVVISDSQRVGFSGALADMSLDAITLAASTGLVGPLGVGAPGNGASEGRGLVISGGEVTLVDVASVSDVFFEEAIVQAQRLSLGVLPDGTTSDSASLSVSGGSLETNDLELVGAMTIEGANLKVQGLEGQSEGCLITLREGSESHVSDVEADGTLCLEGGRHALVRVSGTEVDVSGLESLEMLDSSLEGSVSLEDSHAFLRHVETPTLAVSDRTQEDTTTTLVDSQITNDTSFISDAFESGIVFLENTESLKLSAIGGLCVALRGAVSELDARDGRVVVEDAAMTKVSLDDVDARLEVEKVSDFEARGTGRVSLEASNGELKGRLGVSDFDGLLRVHGGRWAFEGMDARGFDVEDATLEVVNLTRVGRGRIDESEITGPFDIQGGETLELSGLPSSRLIGGRDITLIRPKAGADIALEGHPRAITSFGAVSPSPAPGLPTGDVAVVKRDDGSAFAVVSGVPEHALVKLARRAGGVSAPLGWAFARRGVARFPDVELADTAGLVASVTVDGLTGPWADMPMASCTASPAPAGDEAAASEILVHYDETLPADVVTLARCGTLEASISSADDAYALKLGDGELMRAAMISGLAFSFDCAALAWVAEGVIGETDLRHDVYVADTATGVVTRLTRDAAIEEGTFPTVNAVWFGREDGGDTALAHVDLDAGALIVDLALAGRDLRSPRPSPEGDRVVLLACEGACGLGEYDIASSTYRPLGVDDGCELEAPWWVPNFGDSYLVILRGPRDGPLVPVSTTASGIVRGRL